VNEPRKRSIWPVLIRIVVALALFAWLGTHLDWKTIGATLAAIDPKLAAAGVAVLWLGLGIAVIRWHLLLAALGSDFRWGETTRVLGAGLFLSLFLPTSVGGDIYRLARVGRGSFGPGKAGVSLLAERGIGLLALLVLVSPVVAVHARTRDLMPLALGLGAVAVSMIAILALWGRPVTHFLAARVKILEPVLGRGTWDAVASKAPAVFGLSLVIHLTTVVSNLLFASALHVPLGFWNAMALIPLIILAGQLPIAPGGLGVREAAFVFFLSRADIGREQALAVGITWLAALYLTGLVGALLFLADRRGRPEAPSVLAEITDPASELPAGVDTPAPGP